MRYKVLLTPDAAGDFRALEGSVKKPVARQLKKLEEAPHQDSRSVTCTDLI